MLNAYDGFEQWAAQQNNPGHDAAYMAGYQSGAEYVSSEAVRLINEAREEGESDLRCIRSRIMEIIEDQS